jgi:outer membrane protein assembly factor BamB
MMWTLPMLGLLAVGVEPEMTWPSFLGQGRDPATSLDIPLQWSGKQAERAAHHVAWSVPLLGYGQSSPVIWGDRVFVTTVEGPLKDRYYVSCLQLQAGTLLWRYELKNSSPVENSTFVSRAAPTPVVDGEAVYAFFESGDVVALDHAGQVRWQTCLSERFGAFDNKYGLAASPVADATRLFLLVDHLGPSYVLAIDKRTGEVIWKQARTARSSWTSPVILPVTGGQQLLCSSAGSIDAYELESGNLLWSYTEVGGNRICTPCVFGEGKFLIGSQTSREYADTERVRQSNFAMRVVRTEEAWKPEVLWRAENAMPAMASPMVHGKYAYWINRVGVVSCFDLEDGREYYSQRTKQLCWATPIADGNRIFFFGKDGVTTVLAAGPSFQLLAENTLFESRSEPAPEPAPEPAATGSGAARVAGDRARAIAAAMHAGPEVCGVAAVRGSLLIRTGSQLICIRAAQSGP